MISPTDRAALHAASLEFLGSSEGMVYLQDLYRSMGLAPAELAGIRNEYLKSFQNAEICVANLWMINNGVTDGGDFSGPALLICGGQGSEQSETFVEHLCGRMSENDWQNLSRLSVATIQHELADEEFNWGRCRTLPLDFTQNYPVYLFDTMVGRDSIYLTNVPCLVNPRSEAKAFAIPQLVMKRCGVAMPHPTLDEMLPTFLTTFVKENIVGLFEEDLFRAVQMLILQKPEESAKVLSSFYHGLASRLQLELEPVEFEVTCFKDENAIVGVFVCPEPMKEGEIYFSAVVVCSVGDGSSEAISQSEFIYYLLEKTENAARVLKKVGRDYEAVSEGLVSDLGEFIEWLHGSLGGDHRVRKTASNDEAVAAGIQQARETVPSLIEPFLAGELENFMIKVAITDGHDCTEHMWLDGVSYENGTFAGHITEAPHTLEGFQEGQRFRLPPGDISDWMFFRDGKMHGNYTLRAMLPTMSEAEAQKYRAVLSD